MITRFFSTSKPFHLVLTTLFVFLLFILVRRHFFEVDFSVFVAFKQLSLFIVVFISIALLSFMVNKNTLTHRNSYAILFYSLLIATMPETLKFNPILVSNVFVMLALRRIISLRSNLNIKKKLLDAAIWITIASLFYFWAILFFALIFAALFLYAIPELKNWVIPFFGFLIVLIIVMAYSILAHNVLDDFAWYIQPMDYDLSYYNNLNSIIAITLIISLGVWATFFYINSLKDKLKAFKSAHILIMYTALIALLVIGIAPNKTGSEFLFLFTPLAIIMANFIENVSERWFAELFIWLLIAVPIVGLVL